MILNTGTAVAVAARAFRARPQIDVTLRIAGGVGLRTHSVQRCCGIRYLSLTTQSLSTIQHDSSSSAEISTHLPRAVPTVNASIVPLSNASLPVACPGCGALSQEISANEAGYYSRSRKNIKAYLHRDRTSLQNDESHTHQITALEGLAENHTSKHLQADESKSDDIASLHETPVCDRCHNLTYNNKGTSIAHPSLEVLADSIAESPFRRNHVYHVLDAADFPMSLIPKVFKSLELAKPRSQNRRARSKITGKPTVSFIITRSDLLGSSKQEVDKMMPYFQNVLRSALGREGRHIRLGNVHLVSAKRGWWTKELKDDIWERGGGNWMVGKVNVGKSNLFPVLFPKGSGERAPIYAELQSETAVHHTTEGGSSGISDEYGILEEGLLLPPVQPEVPFPTMPIVSNLPGTTASPIRLSFGNHKGELIDLPGLERGNLEEHVHPDHRLDLVMQFRPNVQKHIIKPGQSLILGGGLVRITPQLDPEDRSMTMIAYPFVPLEVHVTATDKAMGTQLQQRESGIRSILADGAGHSMKSSGTYNLDTDVTKAHAGALLRAKVPLSKLPFRVYSSDILVEGVGWVELVCQVRRKRQSLASTSTEEAAARSVLLGPRQADTKSPPMPDAAPEFATDFRPFADQAAIDPNPSSDLVDDLDIDANHFPIPRVEIFSPYGRHIGRRNPLGASTLWEERKKRRKATSGTRPRKSMKGAKKRAKEASRSKASSTPKNED